MIFKMTIIIILALFIVLFIGWFLLNVITIIFLEETFNETCRRWKDNLIDIPRWNKKREVYLAPVFENHKLKSMRVPKMILLPNTFGGHKKEFRDTTAYFFEIFERKGSRFYSKGFRFLYFQNNTHHNQFLALYQKYNEKNPYKDDDMLLHVRTNIPWQEQDSHIQEIIKYHSHNKTY